VSYRVEFSPEAQADLLDLYDYIAQHAGAARALGYVERIERRCRTLATFPERATRRDDLRPGLRIANFERRATIAFAVEAESVTILRVLYAGRDVAGVFADQNGPG
jgi:toxin ParE1/3/4